MASMKTPGVWIDEKTALPNTVIEVATAVPAFIGCAGSGCAGSRRIDPPDCVRLTYDETAQVLDIASNQPVTAGSARDDCPGQRHAIVNSRNAAGYGGFEIGMADTLLPEDEVSAKRDNIHERAGAVPAAYCCVC